MGLQNTQKCCRGPSSEHSYQVWTRLQLAQWFQRKRTIVCDLNINKNMYILISNHLIEMVYSIMSKDLRPLSIQI